MVFTTKLFCLCATCFPECGESVVSAIDTGVIYPQVKDNPSSIFSFLLVAGYLKAVECNRSVISDYMCRVAIPNKEISFVYRKEILQKLAFSGKNVAVAVE